MTDLHSVLRPRAAVNRNENAIGSDVFLAVLVTAIISLMVLPLPLFLLDTLVAISISLGIVLVLMGIYISSPLQFSTFPSVLLLATLFRLALSIATTRMILSEADAGSVIDTFGSMVAADNIVIGLVVFLIITIVQFLVIAKGAERVAEVGARFTLDAMPGKQMSIDSDLRSGLIDKVEARRKREELELESKLHGSMDGAMKFVKGDAIAGIVIIIVNLLGGLAVGIYQLGLPAAEAMSRYSILTIGDGLVAQIPALMSAMAAGLIVTRVTDGKSDRHLGDSIGKQIIAMPRVLMLAGAMCLGASAVPGFPTSTFVLLGMLLVVSGVLLEPSLRSRVDHATQPAFAAVLKRKRHPRSRVAETGVQAADRAVPLLLVLPARCAVGHGDTQYREAMDEMLHRRRIASGVNLPSVRIHWQRQEYSAWSLHAYEVPVAQGVIGDPSVARADVVEACSQSLRRETSLFIGIQETSNLLAQAANDMPEMVKEVSRMMPIQTIAGVFANLVQEEVSIRNVRNVLEALARAGQFEKDELHLTEYARMALSRQICHGIAPDRQLAAISLTADFEESVTRSLGKVGDTQQLTLSETEKEALVKALCETIDRESAQAIVLPVGLRRHVRALVAQQRFDIPVLSYPEVAGSVTLNMVARVSASDTRVHQRRSVQATADDEHAGKRPPQGAPVRSSAESAREVA